MNLIYLSSGTISQLLCKHAMVPMCWLCGWSCAGLVVVLGWVCCLGWVGCYLWMRMVACPFEMWPAHLRCVLCGMVAHLVWGCPHVLVRGLHSVMIRDSVYF